MGEEENAGEGRRPVGERRSRSGTYDFLSQIINYDDIELEKRSVIYRHLIPWLKTENQNQPIDLSSVGLTHYRLEDLGKRRIQLGEAGKEVKLKLLTDVGTDTPKDREQAREQHNFSTEQLNFPSTPFHGGNMLI